jgi:probable F420-dependent oxidoreductase
MQIGVQFPHEFFLDDVGGIRDFAQAAEGLGYSHLLLYEHVLGAVHADREPPLLVPYDETSSFHEPMVLMGFLAAVTRSIELATGVLVLPQRQTAIVAKQAAEVQLLTGGRLRLGAGVGHNHVEYAGLGADFSTRGARQEEQIGLLRRLWSEPVVDFAGRWDHIDRAGISPRPATPIPVWLGGFSDAAYRRAARIADGFVYSLMGTAGTEDGPRSTVERLRALVGEAGRDQATFGIELLVPYHVTVAEFGALADEWRDAGISHLTLHLLPDHWSTTAEHLRALEQYMAAAGG